jgi:hypothetical protein
MAKRDAGEKLNVVIVNEKGSTIKKSGRKLLLRFVGAGFHKRIPLEFQVEGGTVRILTNSKDWTIVTDKITKGGN